MAAHPPDPGWGALPRLDGTLHVEPAIRQEAAHDAGRLTERLPAAVLRPGSARDVQDVVRFCRRANVPVAPRGLGNTTGGQSLTAGGVVIETRSLAGIRFTAEGAVVGAGVTWLELARAAHERGRAIPAATGYLDLTVGGTLSLGGVPPAISAGAQVDHVVELEVVTGDGELQRCSAARDRELFEAVLAGVGQFGVITSVTVALVPAPQRVRGYHLAYTDRAAFFQDYRTLVHRNEVTEVYGDWWRPGEHGEVHHLNAFVFHGAEPDDDHLLRGLTVAPESAEVRTADYLDHVSRIDDAVAGLRTDLHWDTLAKPWFTVWLPESTAERFVADVVGGLAPHDVGEGGFVLMYVHRRSALTRPSLRLPEADGSDWVYLFTLMTAGPPDDPELPGRMLRRNRELYERARAAGGVRYPIESVEFGPADWAAHYGERWQRLVELKRRYDPGSIMTPGTAWA
ncbi:FAD-binding protein [Pseudonocardia sp. TRM90224]|uniref:FAD-binding protein n=1 Tax=Pseudonocardia sp. TRM90224 TaxID=2812678 RepID=UPI001E3A0C95|nr:FAD-binding protein [Pseudonocardia sp. TRM90224]